MHGLMLTGFMSTFGKSGYRRTAGAHRIATHLRQLGWDIEVLDFVMGWSLEQLKEFTVSRVTSSTKFIGFGGTFPIWSPVLDSYFTWVKEKYPNVTLIAGGQISNLYKIKADWYIDGFGERAMVALLSHLTGNSSEKLKYQIFSNGRKIIKGNLDYPSFPMKSLSIKYQDRDFINQHETLVTELGRGCVFNCKFCNFPILGVKEDHSRDADDLYIELQDTYDRYGVTSYHLADETVNDYTEKLEKFAGAVRRLNFKPSMVGFARADLFASRKQDWDIMMEMGFVGHHYGIESTNIDSLKEVGKGMHPDKLLSGLLEGRAYFKKHGAYKGQVSLIAGLPHETSASLDKSLSWFNNNWKTESIMLFPLYIPKNDGKDTASKLTLEWEEQGYRETPTDLFPSILRKYSKLPSQYGVGDSLLEHTGLSWENDIWNIEEVYKRIFDFYMSPNYSTVYGPVVWSVSEWMLAFEKPFEYFIDKTIADIKSEQQVSGIMLESVIRKQQHLIQSYITKKLNWKA
jgi:hypothetical protein